MKNTFLVIIILLMSTNIFAQESEDGGTWTCPEEFAGQELSIYNWSTYIADNTIPDFEDACDVTVTYTLFDSDDEVYDIVSRGNLIGYDIVIPSGSILALMIEEDLALPLDLEQIPNIENVSAELLNPPYDENNVYSLPYQWGTVAVGYNTDMFPEGITSWSQVWDYEGEVGWLDDLRSMLGIALLTLGYDPNTEDVSEILEARNFLGDLIGDNITIYPDSEGQDALANGDVDVMIEFSGDIIDLTYECDCDNLAYVIPNEGANVWIDNMAIPVGAGNIELAHIFINYVLDPQVSADISNFTAYGSPNQVAIETGLIDQELLDNTGIYPSDDVREGLFFIRNLGEAANNAYNNAWDDILFFADDE